MYLLYWGMMECDYGPVHIYGVHSGDSIVDHWEVHGVDGCLNSDEPLYRFPTVEKLNELLK